MVLAEDHLALSAVLGAPGADATLHGAAQASPVAIRMASLHFLQQRHRPHAGTAGQQRQDVALPQSAKRVDGLSSQRSLGGFLRGQPRISFDPAAGALAHASLGRGNTLGMVAAKFHVQSHLLVGGGASGQNRTSSWKSRFRSCLYARRDQRSGSNPPRRLGRPTVGLRPPCGRPNRPTYVSLTGQLCCRAAPGSGTPAHAGLASARRCRCRASLPTTSPPADPAVKGAL
jgi:hypothetical protein